MEYRQSATTVATRRPFTALPRCRYTAFEEALERSSQKDVHVDDMSDRGDNVTKCVLRQKYQTDRYEVPNSIGPLQGYETGRDRA